MFKWMLMFCMVLSAALTAETKVLVFAGSTREASVNDKLAKEAAQIAKAMEADVTYIHLKDYPIPFYDGDLESSEGMPEEAKQLRALMLKSDVVIISSPEYNGSLSGVLKNAIDWMSRNEQGGPSREAFKGKTFVIMSAAPGAGGGARGLKHLRSIIEDIGGAGSVVPQEIVVAKAYEAFDDEGHLKDKAELEQVVKAALSK